MDNKRSLFSNLDKFYGLADSALLSLFRFGCGIAIARIAGTEGFSTYILLITAAVIFQMLPTTLFLTPLLNLGNKCSAESYQNLHLWAQRGIVKAVSIFLLIGASICLLRPHETLPLLTVISSLFAVSAQLIQSFFRARLQIQFLQKQALLADLATIALNCAISLALWSYGLTALDSFWIGVFVSCSVGNALMRRHLSSKKENAEIDNELIQQASSSGRMMLTGSLANTACSRLQPFIIGIIASTQAIALYGVAWTLIGPIRMLSMALTNLLRPRLSLHSKSEDLSTFNRTYHTALALILAAGISVSFGSWLIGEWAISLLFGQELAAASKLLLLAVLYATVDALTTCQMVCHQILHENGPKLTSILRIQAAIISLTLLVPMTVYFGVMGTLGSLIIAEVYYGCSLSMKSKDQ